MKKLYVKLISLVIVLALLVGVLASCDVINGIIGGATKQPEAPCAGGHSFAEEWSYNSEHHWHAAICEHSDEKSAIAEHTYVDGVCICGAADPHEHSFTDTYYYNEENHWHASTCGHNVNDGLAKHELDEDYACTVCDYQHTHKYSREWSSDES